MNNPAHFDRTIGLKAATAIVIGSIIGSGIFMRPAEMMSLLGSPLQVMGVWVVAGVFTLLSVLVIAEIAAMIPETGGSYAFIKHMYGDFWAYLYGWAAFAVINCAGTAGIAFIAAQYAEYFIPLPRFSSDTEQSFHIYIPLAGYVYPLAHIGAKLLCISLLIVFTIVSYRSTKSGAWLQLLFAAAKVSVILFIVIGILFSGKGEFKNIITDSGIINPVGWSLVAAWVAACNGALQAFDGCNNLLNLTGEIRNPGRNIPVSLISGMLTCILIYLLINTAMMYMLSADTMAESRMVASDAAELAFGTAGGGLVAALIFLSVSGTTQANVFSPPRITFAMANQGNFFAAAGKVHPKFKTPGNALIIHLVVMIFMVLSGSFYILADMYIFIVWLFNLMLMGGIFILRKKYPEKERPFKVPGYPWMPVVVILFNLFYLSVTLSDDINNYLEGKTTLMNSVYGLVVVAMGIPFYLYFRKKHRRSG